MAGEHLILRGRRDLYSYNLRWFSKLLKTRYAISEILNFGLVSVRLEDVELVYSADVLPGSTPLPVKNGN